MPPDLCYSYFQRVSAIVQKFSVLPTPSNCFVNIFLQNIFNALPESYKGRVIQVYSPIKNFKLWNILGVDKILNDCKKEERCLELAKKLNSFLDDFLLEKITVDKFYEMVSLYLDFISFLDMSFVPAEQFLNFDLKRLVPIGYHHRVLLRSFFSDLS